MPMLLIVITYILCCCYNNFRSIILVLWCCDPAPAAQNTSSRDVAVRFLSSVVQFHEETTIIIIVISELSSTPPLELLRAAGQIIHVYMYVWMWMDMDGISRAARHQWSLSRVKSPLYAYIIIPVHHIRRTLFTQHPPHPANHRRPPPRQWNNDAFPNYGYCCCCRLYYGVNKLHATGFWNTLYYYYMYYYFHYKN